MNEDTVGVALLVSNDYETLEGGKTLPGTHRDADNLEKLFKKFTYEVLRKKNVHREDFVSCYKKLSEERYPPTCKRILVYFSGHGGDGTLLMQDGGIVEIGDVVSSFRINISNNKTLAEMAKMFFFDACRGVREDHGHTIKRAMPVNEITCLGRVPKEGNMLVAYASTQYYVSYAGPAGSRWTNCLVKALEESKESDDVCRILTTANIMMRKVPNQQCFQTAEFISNLADYVCFKQEAIKSYKRNIIVVGRTGSGRSSLINNVIEEDHFNVSALEASQKTRHVDRELPINNKKYQCTFIEPPGAFDIRLLDLPPGVSIVDPVQYHVKKIAQSDLRVCLEGLNLIIYVVRQGRFTIEDRKAFQRFMSLFKNAKSISALAITHCECKSDEACTRLLKHFKSDELTEGIAATMGKGIYTVGFPDLNEMEDKDAEWYKSKIQKDVSKLH